MALSRWGKGVVGIASIRAAGPMIAWRAPGYCLGRGCALDPVVDALRDRLRDCFRRRVLGRSGGRDEVRKRPVGEPDVVPVEGLALLAGLSEPFRGYDPANAGRVRIASTSNSEMLMAHLPGQGWRSSS
jgi:hypothetical protein